MVLKILVFIYGFLMYFIAIKKKVIFESLEMLLVVFIVVFSCTETLLAVYELIYHDPRALICQSFLGNYKIYINNGAIKNKLFTKRSQPLWFQDGSH